MKNFIKNIDGSKTLFFGILLFITLDLSALSISFWSAHQSDKDAVKINLAGRQRMLTQRMMKSLLMPPRPSGRRDENDVGEFRDAATLFEETLFVFEHGGSVIGGDGRLVILEPVSGNEALALLAQTSQLWSANHEVLLGYLGSNAPIPEPVLQQVRDDLLGNNKQLLDLMNRLTSSLEQETRDRLRTLRMLQTTVFFFAFVNFVVIVRRFHLLTWRVRLQNDHNSELAARDHLTGVLNRRQYEIIIERELRSTDRRPARKFAVLLLDLDGFKPINDRYGHDAGDQVLITIAGRIVQQARDTDTVARIGGDEFALVCPYLGDESDAERFCERLLVAIQEPITLAEGAVTVGASIGYAVYPTPDNTEHDITKMADTAMYAAKKAGRNRYVGYCSLESMSGGDSHAPK